MKITDICRLNSQEGDVGIEIEVEGASLPEKVVGWNTTTDGSLRGESYEYVLRQPCKREKVDDYLGRMATAYGKCKTKVSPSSRQSIHIHINVQELTLTEVYNFITLFLIFETPLVNFCGEDRKNNLFCLRSVDAEYLLSELELAASPSTIHRLNTDNLRYSAMNVASLFKYGSLEFRSMRGTDDFNLIRQWIDILLTMRDQAQEFESPLAIQEHYRSVGVASFTDRILRGNADVITNQRDWMYDVKMGMRRAQPMAYRGDWFGLSADVKQPISRNKDRDRDRGSEEARTMDSAFDMIRERISSDRYIRPTVTYVGSDTVGTDSMFISDWSSNIPINEIEDEDEDGEW